MLPPRRQLLTRRATLKKISAGALLAMGLWPGALAAGSFGRQRDFKFIVVNDLHLLDDECGTWLAGVVRRMKSHNAELCLLVGDLADDGTRGHLAAVKAIFQPLEIPVLPVIGNHDYVTQTDRAAYLDVFPSRLNYHFEHRGWQFVGVDTTEGQHYKNTVIAPETFRWVDENVRRLDKQSPLVVFTHFPLGAGVHYRPQNADDLLERFRDYNLQAVYNGHFHGFTENKLGQAALTTNRCCALKRGNHDGTKEKGYFLCALQDGVIRREFVECPMPTSAKNS